MKPQQVFNGIFGEVEIAFVSELQTLSLLCTIWLLQI